MFRQNGSWLLCQAAYPYSWHAPTSVVDSALLVDINLAYSFNERFTVSVGGNNIFDETPRELDAMDVLNLISAGPNNGFRFPIRAVPYGFNGASYYMKLAFKL